MDKVGKIRRDGCRRRVARVKAWEAALGRLREGEAERGRLMPDLMEARWAALARFEEERLARGGVPAPVIVMGAVAVEVESGWWD